MVSEYYNKRGATVAERLWANLKRNPEAVLFLAAGFALLLRRGPHHRRTRTAPPVPDHNPDTDRLASDLQPLGEQGSADAEAAKAVLDAQRKTVDDIRAGRAARYYFTAD